MNDLAGHDFRRILLIKPSSPGDVIHALPVLHALRARYPAAHLAWLIATPFADLIEADPALNEVIRFDRKRFGALGRSWGAARGFKRFISELRRKRFDLVVDLQGLFRSGFLAWASGARTRIGPADAREFAALFYTHRVRPDADCLHAVDRNRAVLVALGAKRIDATISITLTEEDQRGAARLLAEARMSMDEPYAVLVPGTRWETKRWPAERYGATATMLRARHGLRTVLVGATADEEAGRRAEAASDGAAVNLCGRTTLRQLAALVRGAAIVVTADSTPMHMAAAFGRPLVALFGPTDPRRTGPYGRSEDVVRLPLPCVGCCLRKLSQCPHDHACMRDLTVEAVAAAASARLAEVPSMRQGAAR